MGKRKPYNISLDEELMREAKKRAIDLRQHLYQFIEEAIRLALTNSSSSESGRNRQAGDEAQCSNRRKG